MGKLKVLETILHAVTALVMVVKSAIKFVGFIGKLRKPAAGAA